MCTALLPTPSLSSTSIPTLPFTFSLALLAWSSETVREGPTPPAPTTQGFLFACSLPAGPGHMAWGHTDPRARGHPYQPVTVRGEEERPPEAYPRATLWQVH